MQERVTKITNAIGAVCHEAARNPENVRLLAISKRQSAEKIVHAQQLGLRHFGENQAQELATKAVQLAEHDICWHFVGNLQRNKVKLVVPHCSWIHSLDSLRLAETIQRLAPRPINCCVQINIAGEASKSGIAPDELNNFLAELRDLDRVVVRGLMCIPPPAADPNDNAPHFRALRELRDQANAAQAYPTPLTELSMGMSDDFPSAIREGATMIRIGTAIFGERSG